MLSNNSIKYKQQNPFRVKTYRLNCTINYLNYTEEEHQCHTWKEERKLKMSTIYKHDKIGSKKCEILNQLKMKTKIVFNKKPR